MSALLKCNVLQQYLLEARVMSCSSNSCYKVLQGLTRMRARKSEQFIQLLRMNLVTGIVRSWSLVEVRPTLQYVNGILN